MRETEGGGGGESERAGERESAREKERTREPEKDMHPPFIELWNTPVIDSGRVPREQKLV